MLKILILKRQLDAKRSELKALEEKDGFCMEAVTYMGRTATER